MKMRCFYSFTTLVVLSSLFSCQKEWLEAKVDKKQAVPSTVTDFQAMLDDDSHFSTSVNRNQVFSEYALDNFYINANVYNNLHGDLKNVYLRAEVEPYKNFPIQPGIYYTNYSKILDMNIIIDRSKRSNDTDKQGINQIHAQALFHRARLYFNLAQIFIPAYNPTMASSDLGLALRLEAELDKPSVRSSVKQTYDQIIADLIVAQDVLPDKPAYLTRASRPAALGLLAKVYLAMGDYTNAFNYANEYLKLRNTLLDYSVLSKTTTFIGVNTEVTFLEFSGSISNFFVEQGFYNSYDANDIRKQVFFQVAQAGISFKGTYGNTRSDVFCGISTDEMYLIRAEGYARSGNLVLAMKDLNDLLRTRWAKNVDGSTKYIDQTASTEKEALEKILIERRKQLVLRNVRWSDLRRLNQDDRFKATLTRTVNGQTYTLEPGSYRYTFPIPYDVIQKSNMQQNPGW